jgi:hypothetical protein
MKLSVLAPALALAVSACAKPNDVATLKADATAIVQFYEPQLDALARRIEAVLAASDRVPKNLPGADAATRALVEARDKLVELRKLKNDVDSQVPQLVEGGKRDELALLVEEEQDKYVEGTTIVNERLDEVESWLADALRTLPPSSTP